MIARRNVRLMSGPDMISGFRLKQSFHSSCGGAGNFFLCSCKEKSHQERKHVTWRPRFYTRITGKAAQIPITYSLRRRNGFLRCTSHVSSSHRRRAYRRYCLTAARFNAPNSWTGTVRRFADLQGVKPGAQANVLSFGNFSLHGQRKVTRSSAGGVEALPFKKKSRNWITCDSSRMPYGPFAARMFASASCLRSPACTGMTSTSGAPRHV
jgi:hypothetical protein